MEPLEDHSKKTFYFLLAYIVTAYEVIKSAILILEKFGWVQEEGRWKQRDLTTIFTVDEYKEEFTISQALNLQLLYLQFPLTEDGNTRIKDNDQINQEECDSCRGHKCKSCFYSGYTYRSKDFSLKVKEECLVRITNEVIDFYE